MKVDYAKYIEDAARVVSDHEALHLDDQNGLWPAA